MRVMTNGSNLSEHQALEELLVILQDAVTKRLIRTMNEVGEVCGMSCAKGREEGEGSPGYDA